MKSCHIPTHGRSMRATTAPRTGLERMAPPPPIRLIDAPSRRLAVADHSESW